jgi:hypothetical protein
LYNVWKTENDALGLVPAAGNAFAPITLPCPSSAGLNGCTIKVDVSSQFWANTGGSVAQMSLTITGAGTLGPSSLVNVSTNAGSLAETHTMQWVKRNIPAGSSPTITMQFDVSSGAGLAGFRTMSIDVFTGLF